VRQNKTSPTGKTPHSTSLAGKIPYGTQGAVAPQQGTVRPLGGAAVRITGGLLADWQRRNREATIQHVIGQLHQAGHVTNLLRLLGEFSGPHRGRYPFGDTDLYKTLEGLAYELARDDDGPAAAQMREFNELIVGLLARVQDADGYITSRYQDPESTAERWSDLTWGHEMYNCGHLAQAAVAAHRQLGDDRLLEIACRYADLIVRRYGDQGEDAVCGHPEAEMAFVELYRVTGREEYLRQAELLVNRRGRNTVGNRVFPPSYSQDHVPLRQMQAVTGHAVRMGYLAAGAADVWLETGEDALGVALRRLWDDMVTTKLYITGGLGSRHSDEAIGDGYEMPSERAYAETCAAIAVMQWAWRMFAATGEARYLDVFETILYNAYGAGLSADGRAFFYDNPLQRRPDHEQRSGAELDGGPLRRPWFGCPCCPPNVVRWMSQLGDYLAAERPAAGGQPGALLIAGYADATIDTGQIAVTMTTRYPWDGDIAVTVRSAPDGPHEIKLRVPGWAHGARLDGHAAEPDDGWLTLRREWHAGDELRLTLPMPVRAHGSHPYLDATRGALAVARGPVIYCAEQQDCEVNLDDLVLTADLAAGATVAPGPAGLPASLAIETAAAAAPPASGELYPELPEQGGPSESARPGGAPARAVLVPYFLWGNREPGPMRVWFRRG
jgi:uncharacterized protein